MPDFVLQGAQEFEATTPSSSEGVTVTANATANTKGSYATLLTASYDYVGLLISLAHPGAIARTLLVDIAVGDSGSEHVVAPNLLLSVGSAQGIIYSYYLPIYVPSGTRVAARAQGTTGSTTCKVSAMGIIGTFNQPSPVGAITAIGVSAAAVTQGTSIDPGGSPNAKGSYTQLIASTAQRYTSLIVAIGQQENSARVGIYGWALDIAIGGSGSEQIVIPDLPLCCDTNGDQIFPCTFPPLPVDIPAGTRIAARAQCTGNDATDRLFDLGLYCW